MYKKILFLLGILALLSGWILWGNNALQCNVITVKSPRLPGAFHGYRIAQISDLHNAEFGKKNERLLSALRKAASDMIAITGDLIDSRRTNMAVALDFVRQAGQIAPCYYVPGNHESRIADYPAFREALEAAGVTVLDNAHTEIAVEEEKITLLGVQDPGFLSKALGGSYAHIMQTQLSSLPKPADGYTILLSHRPELFDTYAGAGMDLVLSGHAHGGQFRLPFLGGVLAPDQGFFPEYDAGLYTRASTNMVVSRGLGNSLFPFRLGNRPEVVLVVLEAENQPQP